MGIRLAQAQRAQVLGRPVELVVVDNKSDKVESANAVNRLIQRDQVAGHPGATLQLRGPGRRAGGRGGGVPLVTAWATNPLVTQGRAYIFRTCFSDPFQGGAAANFAVNNLQARTAAVLSGRGARLLGGPGGFFPEVLRQPGRAGAAHGQLQRGRPGLQRPAPGHKSQESRCDIPAGLPARGAPGGCARPASWGLRRPFSPATPPSPTS